MNQQDYDLKRKYEDLARMQNTANAIGSLGQFAGQYRQNTISDINVNIIPLKELEALQKIVNDEYERRTLDTPLPSPTKRQLNNNEALNQAWQEFSVIWKLVGK